MNTSKIIDIRWIRRFLMAIVTLGLSLLRVPFAQSVSAATSDPDNVPYTSGMLAVFGPPLEDFVNPSLTPACRELENDESNLAAIAFAKAIKNDPTDMASYVGYIQSKRSNWSDLLTEYNQQDKTFPSAYNDFKLGLVAWYIEHTGNYPTDSDTSKIHAIQVLAGAKLDSANKILDSPIIYFTLQGSSMTRLIGFYGGYQMLDSYISARNKDWNLPTPLVSGVGLKSLNLLTWVISDLYDQATAVQSVEIHPSDAKPGVIYLAPGQQTPDQQTASNWIRAWGNAVCAEIRKRGSEPQNTHIYWNSR